VTDAIVVCAGYYVCGSDLFQVGGCVDRALVDARLTSAQEQALTDLCTACKISVIRCQQHTDTNGAHRLGAGVVFASDPVIAAKTKECLASPPLKPDPLTCENDFYNCMLDAITAPTPKCW